MKVVINTCSMLALACLLLGSVSTVDASLVTMPTDLAKLTVGGDYYVGRIDPSQPNSETNEGLFIQWLIDNVAAGERRIYDASVDATDPDIGPSDKDKIFDRTGSSLNVADVEIGDSFKNDAAVGRSQQATHGSGS